MSARGWEPIGTSIQRWWFESCFAEVRSTSAPGIWLWSAWDCQANDYIAEGQHDTEEAAKLTALETILKREQDPDGGI